MRVKSHSLQLAQPARGGQETSQSKLLPALKQPLFAQIRKASSVFPL
jgi:hypothetical protein